MQPLPLGSEADNPNDGDDRKETKFCKLDDLLPEKTQCHDHSRADEQ